MVLLGWPSKKEKLGIPHNIVKEVMVNAQQDVGVLRDVGMSDLKNILIPVGTGPNARLALELASYLAGQDGVMVTALRLMPVDVDEEKKEDHLLHLQEIVEEELGEMPPYIRLKTVSSPSVVEGILSETESHAYDLMIIGASENVFSSQYVFGALNDALIEDVTCSMMIVRRYQPETALWFRQRIKRIEE